MSSPEATLEIAISTIEDELITCEPYSSRMSRRACGARYRLAQTILPRPKAGNQAIGQVGVVASCGLCQGCPIGKANQ